MFFFFNFMVLDILDKESHANKEIYFLEELKELIDQINWNGGIETYKYELWRTTNVAICGDKTISYL